MFSRGRYFPSVHDNWSFWVGVVMFFGTGIRRKSRVLLGLGAYLAALLAIGTLSVAAVDRMARETAAMLPASAENAGAVPTPQPAAKSEVLADSRTTPYQVAQFWSNRPSQSPSPPKSLGVFGGLFNVAPVEPPPPETYATVCVRLCNGYYWPVSFSTSPGNFGADEQACRSSCSAPSRLFVYSNQGGSTDDMQDVQGRPYSRLPNAFLYRTSYDQSCKCKPHPWEQQALDRHRMYALQQSVRKGDRTVVAELREVTARVAEASPQLVVEAVQPRVRPEPIPGMMALGATPAAKAPDRSRAWRDNVFNR